MYKVFWIRKGAKFVCFTSVTVSSLTHSSRATQKEEEEEKGQRKRPKERDRRREKRYTFWF